MSEERRKSIFIVNVMWEIEPSDIDRCERAVNSELVSLPAYTPEEAIAKAKELWDGYWEVVEIVDESAFP